MWDWGFFNSRKKIKLKIKKKVKQDQKSGASLLNIQPVWPSCMCLTQSGKFATLWREIYFCIKHAFKKLSSRLWQASLGSLAGDLLAWSCCHLTAEVSHPSSPEGVFHTRPPVPRNRGSYSLWRMAFPFFATNLPWIQDFLGKKKRKLYFNRSFSFTKLCKNSSLVH